MLFLKWMGSWPNLPPETADYTVIQNCLKSGCTVTTGPLAHMLAHLLVPLARLLALELVGQWNIFFLFSKCSESLWTIRKRSFIKCKWQKRQVKPWRKLVACVARRRTRIISRSLGETERNPLHRCFVRNLPLHYGLDLYDTDALISQTQICYSVSYEYRSNWVSERTKEQSGTRERNEQCGATKWVGGVSERASGPVLYASTS